MAGNLIGEPLKPYVREQIKRRQEVHGKKSRTIQEISYLNSRNSWVKLASGVELTAEKYKEVTGESLGGPKTDGGALAKSYILFNGLESPESLTGTIENRKRDLSLRGSRAGISGDNRAYGVGGDLYGYSPMPGITSVDLKCLNRGSIKKATVKLKAHNTNQFNIIDVLYLRLGYSILLEWGEDKYLDNDGKLKNVFNTNVDNFFSNAFNNADYTDVLPQLESARDYYKGNVDGIFGTISNFSWTFQDDGSYDITIEIISLGDVVESLKANLPPLGKVKSSYSTAQRQAVLENYRNNSKPSSDEFYDDLYPSLKEQLTDWFNDAYNSRKNTQDGQMLRYYDDWQVRSDGGSIYEGTDGESPTAAGGISPNRNERYHDNEVQQYRGNETLIESVVDWSRILPFPQNAGGNESLWDNWSKAEFVDDAKLVNENILSAMYNSLNLYSQHVWKIYRNLSRGGSYSVWNGGKLHRFPRFAISTDRSLIRGEFRGGPNGYYFLGKKGGTTYNRIKDEVGKPALGGGEAAWNDWDKINEIIQDIGFQGDDAYKGLPFWEGYTMYLSTTKVPPFDLDFLLAGVFEYFTRMGLAGGATDPRFEEDTLATSIEDVSNKNRIYKWLSDIEAFTAETLFHSKVGNFIKSTFLGSEKKLGYTFPGGTTKQVERWNRDIGKDLKYPKATTSSVPYYTVKLNIDQEYSHFVNLGFFLSFLQNRVIPKIEKSQIPMIKIDLDARKNIMYVSDNALSTNPKKCIVKNISFFNGSFEDVIYKGLYDFMTEDGNYKWGEIMNIYFNTNRLKEIVDSVDEKGNVSIYKLIKTICVDINECLGNINNLEPIIGEDNTIKIIDQTPIPGIKEIAKSLNIDIFDGEDAVFEIFGYNHTGDFNPSDTNPPPRDTEILTSNFVNKIGITTEINKKYATMITIGATANGSVPGMEATAFSRWNKGITDRFKNNLVDAEITDPQSSINQLENLQNQNVAVIDNYKDFIKEGYAKLGYNIPSNSGDDLVINDDYIDINTTTVSDFYKYAQAKITIKNPISGSQSSVGFLPFNLKMDMDGLSGIKIYNKIKVNTEFLPPNYGNTLDFIITGVNHKIQKNKWTTHLTTLATSTQKESPISSNIVTNEVLELESTGTSAPSIPSSGYTDVNPVACGGAAEYITDATLKAEMEKKNTKGDASKSTKLIHKIFSYLGTNSGICALYTISIANQYWNAATNPSAKISSFSLVNSGGTSKKVVNGTTYYPKDSYDPPGPRKPLPGGLTNGWGDAKWKSFHDKILSKIKTHDNKTVAYKRYRIGKNLSKSEVKALITSIYNKGALYPGDMFVYWDHSGTPPGTTGSISHQQYGHAFMYFGGSDEIKKYYSDFKHSNFVYGGPKYGGECWEVIYFKSPDVPITIKT